MGWKFQQYFIKFTELLSQYYEAPVEAKRNPALNAYRKHFVPGKRAGSLPNLGIYRRPTLNDYMKLAAIEMELENAAAAEGLNNIVSPPSGSIGSPILIEYEARNKFYWSLTLLCS